MTLPSDPLERVVAEALRAAGHDFKLEDHPDRRAETPRLDFLLDNGLRVEVKRFHTPRLLRQLASAENVILLQGKGAVEWFAAMVRQGR